MAENGIEIHSIMWKRDSGELWLFLCPTSVWVLRCRRSVLNNIYVASVRRHSAPHAPFFSPALLQYWAGFWHPIFRRCAGNQVHHAHPPIRLISQLSGFGSQRQFFPLCPNVALDFSSGATFCYPWREPMPKNAKINWIKSHCWQFVTFFTDSCHQCSLYVTFLSRYMTSPSPWDARNHELVAVNACDKM